MTEEERPRSEWEIEEYRQHEEWERLQGDVYSRQTVSMSESVAGSALLVCRSAILLNGGASVAVLAFLGQLFVREENAGLQALAGGLSQALCLYVIGTVAAFLLSGASYVAQHYAHKNLRKQVNVEMSNMRKPEKERETQLHSSAAVWWRFTALIFGLASLVSFVWGSWLAKTAFMAEIARMAG